LEPPDPFDFARAFLLARTEAKAHGVDAINGLTLLNNICWSSCPMGLDTLMLMPDGVITVCYLPPAHWQSIGLESIAGHMTVSGELRLLPERLLAARLLLHNKSRCERCFCRWTCAGGCHARQTPAGCSDEYNSTCIQTRLVTAALLLEQTGMNPLRGFLDQISCAQKLALHADDRVCLPSGQTVYC
jgi:radical SAM protein with 4Fe4S-binding SPASM domain